MIHEPVLASDDPNALWQATMQTVWRRASHDVKDALNGVSVNVEVIRLRAARPDLPASALAQFGEAAAGQVERLATLLDALLGLSRPEREPVDVSLVARRIVEVLNASSSSSDAHIMAVCDRSVSAMTRANPVIVRLVIAAPLLALVTSTGRGAPDPAVQCRLTVEGDGVQFRIASDARQPTIPENVAEFARAQDIGITEDENALTLTFPFA